MKYMGSKNRISKHIVPILLDLYEKQGCKYFVDTMVGGANLLDKIPPTIKRIGNDSNEYLIAMWQAVSKGWMPPEIITEQDYYHIRQNKDDDKALTGYVGFALSYGGKWFGGYRRDVAGTKDKEELRISNEITQSTRSYNSLIKQSKLLKT